MFDISYVLISQLATLTSIPTSQVVENIKATLLGRVMNFVLQPNTILEYKKVLDPAPNYFIFLFF